MKAVALPLFAVLVAGPGCFSSRDQCSSDEECEGGGECTRTGECVADGTALRVVVRWTVDGRAPTPASPEPCDRVGELEVIFRDPGSDPENYRPVPCNLGQTVYDKMPPRFEAVEVVAYAPSGRFLDSAEAPLAASGETDVQLDLTP